MKGVKFLININVIMIGITFFEFLQQNLGLNRCSFHLDFYPIHLFLVVFHEVEHFLLFWHQFEQIYRAKTKENEIDFSEVSVFMIITYKLHSVCINIVTGQTCQQMFAFLYHAEPLSDADKQLLCFLLLYYLGPVPIPLKNRSLLKIIEIKSCQQMISSES